MYKMATYTDKTYFKDMEITLTAEFKKSSREIKLKQTAKIGTDDFTFQSMAQFQKDLQLINSYIKKFTKNATYFEMSICISEYQRHESWKELKQISFNWWDFKGYNESEDGVYLQPDTRYTEAEHDCWYDFTIESLPNP